ncbi:MAG: glutaminyl-peptide cyclotransferase [Paraprevotella sp.]|nr:glutaminyl-peptide cyclotransferase [Paraprevotella sp.]
MVSRRHILIPLILLLCCSCSAKVRQYRLEVVKEYPHDVTSYTQGLFFHGGQMFESTGQYGMSTFRKVDMATGKPLKKLDFARKYFIEGSVMLDGSLYILTWMNKVVFVYDAETLEYRSTYSYPREGWGLTTDGKSLIASDGSATLYFMSGDFAVKKRLTVRMDGRPVRFLNELEYIDGKIWANVYTTDLIIIIDPGTGNVEATVDASGLLPDRLRTEQTDVLNGIAYNSADGRIYLTGKNWPKLYEIRLKEK